MTSPTTPPLGAGGLRNDAASGRAVCPEHGETGPEGGEAAFSRAMVEHMRVISSLYEAWPVLEVIAARMVATLSAGGRILFCGNGGSAADAQHLAAELVGRFQKERAGLAAIALTTDTSVLTAIANDYGYAEVFRRQVEALGRRGDLLVGLSTSGSSENVCAALEAARSRGLFTVAMCGEAGGRAAELADVALRVASTTTARVQEAHLFCGHWLCEEVEAAMVERARRELPVMVPGPELVELPVAARRRGGVDGPLVWQMSDGGQVRGKWL